MTSDVFLHSSRIIGQHPEKCLGKPGTDPAGPEIEFDLEIQGGRPKALNACLVEIASDAPQDESGEAQDAQEAKDTYGSYNGHEVDQNSWWYERDGVQKDSYGGEGEVQDSWYHDEKSEGMDPQEILEKLPKNAPAGVRQYFVCLARAKSTSNY